MDLITNLVYFFEGLTSYGDTMSDPNGSGGRILCVGKDYFTRCVLHQPGSLEAKSIQTFFLTKTLFF